VSNQILWRLSPGYHADKALSGDGSYRRGGRWSPPGIRVVYCADSRSLALVEVLANIRRPSLIRDQQWVLIRLDVPENLIERPTRVPETWRETPYTTAPQAFGAEWVQSQRSVALRVPSVVVPGEFNYLLNPAHPQFAKVKVGKPEPFPFDPRLAAAP
jgi:RES domain-containing protein